MSSDVQVTVAVVAFPVLFTKPKGEELLAPVAIFQLLSGTTPATSELAISVPIPRKSMLITFVEKPEAETSRIVLVECVSEPLTPVMVRVEPPAGVLAVVATVRVEVPDVVIVAGEKEPVVPAGRPVTLKAIDPVKPGSAVTVTV
jgi:hypothetical protein